MSYKKLSVALLTFFAATGAAMIYFATKLKVQRGAMFVNGSQFFPMLLGGLIVLFCICSVIDTLRKPEDEVVTVPKFGNIAISLGLTILWTALWQYVGYFYVVSFVFVALFIYIFNPAPHSPRKIRETLVFDVIIIAVIYLVFTVGLKTQL